MIADLAPGLLNNLLMTLALVYGVQVLLWVISMITKDATSADWWWGAGFGVIAAFTYFNTLGIGLESRKLIILACTCLWGARLSLHIFWRSKADGFRELDRYEKYRTDAKAAGVNVNWYIFKKVFGIQAFMMWFTSLPIQVAMFYVAPAELGLMVWIGVAVWATGFLIESITDTQLQLFKMNPANKGTVLNKGLWKYSRHPNYFGDALVWWGIFLIGCDNPIGLLTILSPLRMTYRLGFRQGINWLEDKMSNMRPDYADYVRRTNRFFPWFPKK